MESDLVQVEDFCQPEISILGRTQLTAMALLKTSTLMAFVLCWLLLGFCPEEKSQSRSNSRLPIGAF